MTKFSINDEDGFKILYDSLVRSGPAYKLIVHESPAWFEIRDSIQNPEQIVILDEKQAEYYKQASKDFFAPFTEGYRTYKKEDGTTDWTSNLVMDMRCALSYILIAYDYKARIFEKDILNYSNPLESMVKNGARGASYLRELLLHRAFPRMREPATVEVAYFPSFFRRFFPDFKHFLLKISSLLL